MRILDLKLTRFQSDLALSQRGDGLFVFDPLRKKHLLLTPEEWVRQLLIRYLLREKNYPAGRLAIEQSVHTAGQTRRFDLLAYNAHGLPYLLVECKAPQVKITQKAFDQIAAYNQVVKAPYLLLTNGPETICCQMNYDATSTSYVFLDEVPAICL